METKSVFHSICSGDAQLKPHDIMDVRPFIQQTSSENILYERVKKRLKDLRASLPEKYQEVDSFGYKIGNIAYSTSDIEGCRVEELKSFSKYGSKGKNGIKNSVDGWVSSVENPRYNNDVLKINSENEIDNINGYPRNNDTEYKIIEEYNQILNGHYEVKGKIIIASEREVCPSCDNVIKAFSKDYSNIEIILIASTGKIYFVKNGVVQ